MKETAMSNMVMLNGVEGDGLVCYKGPGSAHNKPEFAALVNAHKARLYALLDKPVVVTVHWDDGDSEALFSIMPTGGKIDPKKKFETFTLPFPQ